MRLPLKPANTLKLTWGGRINHHMPFLRAADFTNKVQDYIERNYQDKLHLDELADVAQLGQRTFQRRFKRATHYTANTYIQKVRIEAAKKFLEYERLTVSEIIFEVGYSDFEASRKVFKRETGLSPLQYRAKYRERQVG